jgi:hypothetical protein
MQTRTPRQWPSPIYSRVTASRRARYPLFFALPRRSNSRISAAKAMSLADNFLQKQQEQRERQFAKGRCGNPARRPRGSRNRIDPRRRARLILRWKVASGAMVSSPLVAPLERDVSRRGQGLGLIASKIVTATSEVLD